MADLLDAARLLRCSEVDCRPPASTATPPSPAPVPGADYMAKDYDSFLRALLDQLPSRVPGWGDTSEASLGMAILELWSYVADQLSYYQDRVANEGYLRTATRYDSVRRLLRLVDYRLHPGRAAVVVLRYWVGAPTVLPAGHRVTTHVAPDAPFGDTPVVFETTTETRLDPTLDAIPLAAAAPADAARTEVRLAAALAGVLSPGGWLLFMNDTMAEWARVAELSVAGGVTTVQLATPLGGTYAAGLDVFGNGVHATHGESYTLRADGTGLPWQALPIEEAPITVTADDDGEPVSSLVVEVDGAAWREVEDFVDSGADDTHYRVARDDFGFATIEFGDGAHGRVPPVGTRNVVARYRIGLGDAGLVASGALRAFSAAQHVVRVLNPLPSTGARAPETLEEARLLAPQLARRQLRAVTAADYADVLREGVRVGAAIVRPLHARAHFRWVGSWTTVSVSVDLEHHQSLTGVPAVRAAFEARLAERRLAGHDVALREAAYAPLHVSLVVRVRDGYFAREVRQAVERALAGRGTQRPPAFFAAERFDFGQAVHLSDLYAAVMAVEGVASVQVTRFKRLGDRFPDREAEGFIPIGPLEIARLDGDPAAPGQGLLFVRTCGGKEG